MSYQELVEPGIDFLSAIILFGILQGFMVFLVFLIKKPLGYQFLGLFIAIILIQQIEFFLFYSGYLIYVPHVYFLALPLLFLSGPVILGYLKKLSGESINKKFFFHYLFFILYFTYSSLFYVQPAEKKLHHYITSIHPDIVLPKPGQFFDVDPFEIHGFIVVEFMALFIIVYGILGISKVYMSQLTHKKNTNFSWLILLNILLISNGVVMLIAEGGVIEGVTIYNSILPSYTTSIYVTFSMYVITGYLIFNTKIYKSHLKYQKSSLKEEIRTAKSAKLLQFFETEKPYLDSSFSLKTLAEATKISENHISEILNQELKITFYELTNKYRIAEAKKLLDNTDDIKIEQMAYEIGYKSKSTFFNAFKKQLSQTPLQYKKSLNKRK